MTETLGLIAGSGRFPILFAHEARRAGAAVVAVAIAGVTEGELGDIVDKLKTFKLGQISAPLKFLKNAGVRRVIMAGKVQHASLFGGIFPDLRAVKILAGLKDRRTDTVLSALAAEFAKEGIELISSATFLSHLLAPPGIWTQRKPTPAENKDIDLGWRAAKAVAAVDIGQTVVVQEAAVVAVEAMEGTDAAVLRAAQIAASHGQKPSLVVVKVAKPRQDFRFDLPVIGLETLKTFKTACVRVLAIEAGKALVFDRAEFVAKADALGLAIVARVEAPETRPE